MELLVENGFVYDPLNEINGEKMDIAIKDGKIVEKVDERSAKKIDASGMVVMPGGVDIHCHIAGSEVNTGRLLRPEDHFRDYERKTATTRAGVGRSIPTTFTTGYRYSRMGYTTIMNPSMPPLEAKHTHEELNDTPMVDKATYPLLGDWWFVLEYLKNGDIHELARYVAWMITAIRGYAIKIVNPGGLEAWGFGDNMHSLDDQVPHFRVTPREILRGLCQVNRMLNLPHTIHVHTNNLGKPGNYTTLLDTMKSVADLAPDDDPAIHITHAQFSNFKGSDWRTMDTGAEEVAKYVNNHHHVTLDMGQVVFTDTTTMTADGPFQYGLYQLSGNKWVNHDVETETSAGIVPFHYSRKSHVNVIQWSIGLELALLIDDPWKVYLTTDHPNAAPFKYYPQIVAWLMSDKARKATMKRVTPRGRRRSLLPSIDRELSLYEIAVMTRAGQAKALTLEDKGHLGVGADADLAIYKLNPEKDDPTTQWKKVRWAFANTAYTIKDGEIVAKDGEILKDVKGRTRWLNIQVREPIQITEDMKRRFSEYWTVEYENYPVTQNYLEKHQPITVKADV
ncbi:MAG: formylmethanofuran dehydrogenase subunit A [Thermoproteota archaeon]